MGTIGGHTIKLKRTGNSKDEKVHSFLNSYIDHWNSLDQESGYTIEKNQTKLEKKIKNDGKNIALFLNFSLHPSTLLTSLSLAIL